MYVVPGVLYESLLHPRTILSGLPPAALGVFATIWLFELDLSGTVEIGKNAIMVVDVALACQRAGADPLTPGLYLAFDGLAQRFSLGPAVPQAAR